MKCDDIKEELIADVSKYVDILHRLPLHPRNKLLIISRYVYSKLRWRFAIYKLSDTWVIQQLDSIVKEYVKRWLLLPQCSNFRHLYLPSKHLGLKFSLPSDIYKASQLTTRSILQKSNNNEIKELYHLTKSNFVSQDVLLHQEKPVKVSDRYAVETAKEILSEISTLKEQNCILNVIAEKCTSSSLIEWQKVCDRLPKNIFVFVRKALIFCLPNNTNLFRWKKNPTPSCAICHAEKQTQLHILNNCKKAVDSGRYTWRHNSILVTLCHYLSLLENVGYKLYADIEGRTNPAELFNNLRPDVALLHDDELIVIELTCCFETNFTKSRQYKIDRYKHLEGDCKLRVKEFKKVFLEVSSLGFLPKEIKTLKNICKLNTEINTKRLLQKICEVALRSSYFIFTKRNADWPNPDLLNFF